MITRTNICTQNQRLIMFWFDSALSQSHFLISLDSQFLLSSGMAGSKAVRSATMQEAIATTLTVRNQPPLPPPQIDIGFETVIPLHLYCSGENWDRGLRIFLHMCGNHWADLYDNINPLEGWFFLKILWGQWMSCEGISSGAYGEIWMQFCL